MARGLPDEHVPARNRQVWRLNQQGLLAVVLADDSFAPGGPAEWPEPISAAEAKTLLARLKQERWTGSPWPGPGDTWSVVDGRVVIREAGEVSG